MNTIDGELNDLLYDVGLTFLPKDCAMVGDTLISPPRKRTMKEDTAKEYAEAIKAVETYIAQEENKARIDELSSIYPATETLDETGRRITVAERIKALTADKEQA